MVKKIRRKKNARLGKDEIVFFALNNIMLIAIIILTLYPLFYVIGASLSRPYYIITSQVWLFPKGFTFAAYQELFSKPALWRAYGNSLFYTFGGTAVSMVFTIIGAYFLSRRPKGYLFFLLMIVINLWFKAGVVPTFLNYLNLGLYNTRAALIIGGAIDAYYLIILKSFFDSLPKELEESAFIDGANGLQVLFNIHLPLSKTALSTISVFYIVANWNAYFWPMVLLNDIKKQPLQLLLRKWIIQREALQEHISIIITESTPFSTETFIYAAIVVAMVPMLILYPFAQRFFQKGVMIGSVKG